MTSNLPEYEFEDDVQDDLLKISKEINEVMFMDSARSVAAESGVCVRNRADLAKFLSGELRPVSASAQVAASLRDELSSMAANKRVSTNASMNASANAPANVSAPLYKNADSPELAKEYRAKHLAEYLHSKEFSLVANNGDIVDVKCPRGHVHSVRTEHVVAYGLKTCHTCKCTNPMVNSVRQYLETVTGAPFTLEGDNCLVSASARMRVHVVAAGEEFRISRARKYLTVYVPAYRPVDRLAKRLTSTTHEMRDGRNISQLARDYGIAMTSAFTSNAFVSSASTSADAAHIQDDGDFPSVRVTPSLNSIFG